MRRELQKLHAASGEHTAFQGEIIECLDAKTTKVHAMLTDLLSALARKEAQILDARRDMESLKDNQISTLRSALAAAVQRACEINDDADFWRQKTLELDGAYRGVLARLSETYTTHKAEKQIHEQEVQNLQEQLAAAVRAGCRMHQSICGRNCGVRAGFGLVLGAGGCAGSSGAVVAQIIQGGAASRVSKKVLAVGDLIVQVDGIDVSKISVAEVESVLSGPIGASVRIITQRSGSLFTLVLVRGYNCEDGACFHLLEHMQVTRTVLPLIHPL